MRRLLVAALTSLLFVGAFAQEKDSTPAPAALDTPQAPATKTPARHPLLWKVTGKNSTVYLFGSVHILSPSLVWRDARIDAAIAQSGTFYFETELDPGSMQALVASRGTLPAGQSLRAMLPPDYQKYLDDDLAELGVPEATLDGRRPWLASLVMLSVQLVQQGASANAGVDVTIMAEAKAHGKPLRYFETNEQQLALLAPDDPNVELKAFEMFLKDFKTDRFQFKPLTDAWLAGDKATLEALLLKDMGTQPGMRKMMFDDRNKRFADKLKPVLDGESGTFFVTVGAGHLLTKRGVPELLRRAGYKVEEL